jgi:hypothetical protein
MPTCQQVTYRPDTTGTPVDSFLCCVTDMLADMSAPCRPNKHMSVVLTPVLTHQHPTIPAKLLDPPLLPCPPLPSPTNIALLLFMLNVVVIVATVCHQAVVMSASGDRGRDHMQMPCTLLFWHLVQLCIASYTSASCDAAVLFLPLVAIAFYKFSTNIYIYCLAIIMQRIPVVQSSKKNSIVKCHLPPPSSSCPHPYTLKSCPFHQQWHHD